MTSTLPGRAPRVSLGPDKPCATSCCCTNVALFLHEKFLHSKRPRKRNRSCGGRDDGNPPGGEISGIPLRPGGVERVFHTTAMRFDTRIMRSVTCKLIIINKPDTVKFPLMSHACKIVLMCNDTRPIDNERGVHASSRVIDWKTCCTNGERSVSCEDVCVTCVMCFKKFVRIEGDGG